MSRQRAGWLLCFFLAACNEPRRSHGLQAVAGEALCVTSGELLHVANNRLQVRVPSMRAEMRQITPQKAELQFRYMGPTSSVYALSSGAQRRQIGLKLRASDPCNLLYVMWRIEPVAALVVSVKSNPDAHTSSACGAHGYVNLRPSEQQSLPAVAVGSEHRLRAELVQTQLRVEADGGVVWVGDVGGSASHFEGPVGMRSDNGLFEMQLRVGAPLRAWTSRHCTATIDRDDES